MQIATSATDRAGQEHSTTVPGTRGASFTSIRSST